MSINYGFIDASLFCQKEAAADKVICIDVRSNAEFAAQQYQNSVNLPLGQLDKERVQEVVRACGGHAETPVYLLCLSGVRSEKAAKVISDFVPNPVFVVQDGLQGLPKERVVNNSSAPIPLIRQVMILAGSMVLLGVLLGTFVGAWGYFISGFMGAGLLFAGISGFCPAAELLSRMPWNQAKSV